MGLLLESCALRSRRSRATTSGLARPLVAGGDVQVKDRLPHLSLPKLFVHGDRDGIIPIALGQRGAAAKAPKELCVGRAPITTMCRRSGRSLFCHTVGVYCESDRPMTRLLFVQQRLLCFSVHGQIVCKMRHVERAWLGRGCSQDHSHLASAETFW